MSPIPSSLRKILAVVACVNGVLALQGAATPPECTSSEHKAVLNTVWQNRKTDIEQHMLSGLENSDPQGLYDTQVYTNNLFAGAAGCGDYKVLDELAGLYLKSYPFLKATRLYKIAMGGSEQTFALSPSAKTWLDSNGEEIILDSSQFLYLLSYAIDVFAGIPESQRTTNMKDLIQKFSPVILNDHYRRWIFGEGVFHVHSWGCDEAVRYNHQQILEKKLNRRFTAPTSLASKPTYCNAIGDWDMWILAGVVEILSANRNDPAKVIISPTLRNQLLGYVSLATQLLASRLQESRLTDFQGHSTIGLNFELGVWDSHPENAYSGYTGEAFPKESDQRATSHVGWDIAHADRFVYVFETLHTHRDVTGQSFPDLNTMRGLTNQVVYGTFNKDYKKPLFTNYMDGTNGWNKVNPDPSKAGFGYAPYDLSLYILDGPWGFWSKYNPDMRKIQDALWTMIKSTDRDVVRHRERHYGQYYENYKRTAPLTFSRSDSYELLGFLPTFLPFGSQSGVAPSTQDSRQDKARKRN